MRATTAAIREPGLEADSFARLIAALREPARYADRPERVDLLETHISCILLAGGYAYKIKKPVNLGFLDFTSLAARRFYCEEEVRLNRRTAPSLYLNVIPITGSAADPVLGGEGPPIEYAIRMRRFPQDALLDSMARNRTLAADCMDTLGAHVGEFHRSLEPAGADRAYASSAQVLAAALQNFDQIRALAGADEPGGALESLRTWTTRQHAALAGVFEARKRNGFVRECHGDLHLRNIVQLDGDPVLFDCIEFNAAFRWIDVMSDIAFLVMDLQEYGLAHLAFRFLNRYLETTGDYEGLRVMRFYIVYRALVRAKVARIRGTQPGASPDSRAQAARDYARYLAFAQSAATGACGALIVMHGLSGSGKSTAAKQLAESLHLVHLRSDVERKRLHGLRPRARTASGLSAGIYTRADTERTYARLAELACHVIAAGYPAIVDAAFLAARHREQFRRLAREVKVPEVKVPEVNVPFAIVSCTAPAEVLRQRLAQREAQGNDASEAGLAVLEQQQMTCEPLAEGELADVIQIHWRNPAASLPGVTATLARRLGVTRDIQL